MLQNNNKNLKYKSGELEMNGGRNSAITNLVYLNNHFEMPHDNCFVFNYRHVNIDL